MASLLESYLPVGLIVSNWVPYHKGYIAELTGTTQYSIRSAFLHVTSLTTARYLWSLALIGLLKTDHPTTHPFLAWIPPKSESVSDAVCCRYKSVVHCSDHCGGMTLDDMPRRDVNTTYHFVNPPPADEVDGVGINVSEQEIHCSPTPQRCDSWWFKVFPPKCNRRNGAGR